MIKNDKNYAIALGDNGQVLVNSSNGNKIIATSPDGGEKFAISVADEQLKLYDGKILKRIKNNLIIEQGENDV